jgi:hypothetical protein
MAQRKTAKKSPSSSPSASKAPKGKSKKSKASSKKSASSRAVSESSRELLRALPTEFAERPTFSVASLLDEARELDVTTKKLGAELVKGTRLDKNIRSELAARRALLDAAETEWIEARERSTPRNVVKLRAAAEKLKREAFAALRYFASDDPSTQVRLDEIAEGSGDVDLIDDVQKLSDLVGRHASSFSSTVPKNLGAQLAEAGRSLADATAERAVNTEAAVAGDLRNRAYWHLRDLMDEIRAAGRYVFRNEPKILTLFRASSTRAKQPV